MRAVSLFAGVLLGVFLTGCTHFEYTGREFAPLAEGTAPRFYSAVRQVPAGVYSVIGRAELTANGSLRWESLQRRLLEEAARRGADAVAVVSRKSRRTAFYEDDSLYDLPSDRRSDPYDLTPDGAEIKVSLTGSPVGLPAERCARVQTVVRALFYKNKTQLEKIISERDKQLEKLISKPQALPRGSR